MVSFVWPLTLCVACWEFSHTAAHRETASLSACFPPRSLFAVGGTWKETVVLFSFCVCAPYLHIYTDTLHGRLHCMLVDAFQSPLRVYKYIIHITPTFHCSAKDGLWTLLSSHSPEKEKKTLLYKSLACPLLFHCWSVASCISSLGASGWIALCIAEAGVKTVPSFVKYDPHHYAQTKLSYPDGCTTGSESG